MHAQVSPSVPSLAPSLHVANNEARRNAGRYADMLKYIDTFGRFTKKRIFDILAWRGVFGGRFRLPLGLIAAARAHSFKNGGAGSVMT